MPPGKEAAAHPTGEAAHAAHAVPPAHPAHPAKQLLQQLLRVDAAHGVNLDLRQVAAGIFVVEVFPCGKKRWGKPESKLWPKDVHVTRVQQRPRESLAGAVQWLCRPPARSLRALLGSPSTRPVRPLPARLGRPPAHACAGRQPARSAAARPLSPRSSADLEDLIAMVPPKFYFPADPDEVAKVSRAIFPPAPRALPRRCDERHMPPNNPRPADPEGALPSTLPRGSCVRSRRNFKSTRASSRRCRSTSSR